MEKAEERRRSEHEPAEVYPDSMGKLEKDASMKTQYDPATALSRI